jgi:hypothetical protein
MGLLTQKMMVAKVVLGDFEPGTVQAAVSVNARGRNDPRDLVAFVPMVMVAVMRACRNEPQVAAPFVGLCEAAADALLDVGPDASGAMRLRDALAAPSASLPGAQEILEMGIPTVSANAGSRPHRSFKAELRLGRREAPPFVKIFSANGYIAAMGTLALFEHVAQTEDYTLTTRPMAAAAVRLLELAEETGMSPIPDFDEATLLFALADRLASEKNPYQFELGSDGWRTLFDRRGDDK